MPAYNSKLNYKNSHFT